ncbi:MAG: UvrD-helicase domain-containing protein [Myxococcales bacterium]|nr:UvrD-helicase domain-containing protein [Myxococcales bacterium]
MISRPASAVVDASAGTGKTHAIETIVANEVLLGTPLERILVITFTEKAARELEQRTRSFLSALQRASRCDGALDSNVAREWSIDAAAERRLALAQIAFGRATISTIHAFCHDILRDTAFLSGRALERTVESDHRVFDAASPLLLRRITTDPFLATWIRRWTVERSIPALLDLMKRVWLCRARVVPEFRPHALEEALIRLAKLPLRTLSRAVDLASSLRGPTKSAIRTRLHELHRIAATFVQERDHLAALFSLEDHERWAFLLERIDPEWPDAEAWRDAIFDLVEVRSSPEAASVGLLLPALADVVDEVLERRGWMTFSNMVADVAEAMRGPRGSEIVRSVRDRFDLALIDEFQDTDAEQWSIFRRVFAESPAHGLVLVGDPKQAIYGFRGADLHTYLEARKERLAAGASEVTLDACYRSTPALVSVLNEMFLERPGQAPFFSGPVNLPSPLVAGQPERRGLFMGSEELPALMLLSWPEAEDHSSVTAVRRSVASGLAHHLRWLVDREPFIEEGRPLRLGDIFMLARTTRDAETVTAALRRAGLSAVLLQRGSTIGSEEAKDLKTVLEAIAEPSDLGRCLAGWSTPSSASQRRISTRCIDLDPQHPLLRALVDARAHADRGRLPEAIRTIVEQGGLRERLARDPRGRARLPSYEAALSAVMLAADERARAWVSSSRGSTTAPRTWSMRRRPTRQARKTPSVCRPSTAPRASRRRSWRSSWAHPRTSRRFGRTSRPPERRSSWGATCLPRSAPRRSKKKRGSITSRSPERGAS